MAFAKDKSGLYYQGEFIADNWTDAVKEVFQLNEIPEGFCVASNYEAGGYSIVDNKGVQHLYELSPSKFYDQLMKLD